jgi:hypothetical protein
LDNQTGKSWTGKIVSYCGKGGEGVLKLVEI